MSVPDSYQFLFPSSPVDALEIQRDKTYIIETLLKNSSLDAWQWMSRVYTKNDIIAVLKIATNLRKKDVLLWSNLYNVPESEIACLQTTFRSGHKSSWVF